MQKLELLVEKLGEENAIQNLVSANSLKQVWVRHIADSAQLLDHVPRETPSLFDLGSGAGFPGLVIAAMRPGLRVTLVESRKRRIDWLERMVSELHLDTCVVEGRRLEAVEGQRVGAITARAFAPLEKLLSLSARFSTKDTTWALPKGRSAAQELRGVSRKWQRLFHVEQSITDPEAAILVGRGVPKGKGAA
ncbi:16S rRNA (guanine(527)-N(7))-methyltransferase RsmG [Parerythrobacter jejuensis]|uniref:Ribosomal RNA small subunit methyltransferase G n=1 Tax=Parerythrobacter jejuensis TaxID=795812 RepID=A0A845AVY9_9SPHN|nr:16S rRNA (guanine(527)-N(7))-methyltransferase RsmG [Parerythrobacter jejuensis]MXP30939.1 16S rRNA (guanine(527)-N(7))-methyltransferase RsmG [Parerythrobacter jejuensis]MXP33699.1 16S rRNA (guanine(527)-N(7))-methyltransferase RsmG [Parerythrobacter jejuensis]